MGRRILLSLPIALLVLASLIYPVLGSGEFRIMRSIYIGTATVAADSARDIMVLGSDASKGYVDVLVVGRDYTPEPDHFDAEVLQLSYKARREATMIYRLDVNKDGGYAPASRLLPGRIVGANWTAIVAADRRPYGSRPSSTIMIYGIMWDGAKLRISRALAEINVGMPAWAIDIYPGYHEGEILVYYLGFEKYVSGSSWEGRFGVIGYDLAKRKVEFKALLPLAVARSRNTYTLTLGDTPPVTTSRYSSLLVPCRGERGVAAYAVLYLDGNRVHMASWRISLAEDKVLGSSTAVWRGYTLYLAAVGRSMNYEDYVPAVLLLNPDESRARLMVLGCSSNGLEASSTSDLYLLHTRVYLPPFVEEPVIVAQLHGVVGAYDAGGAWVKLVKYNGRYYARITECPGLGRDARIVAVGIVAAYSQLYFALINPPGSLTSTTPAIILTPTTTTTRTTSTATTATSPAATTIKTTSPGTTSITSTSTSTTGRTTTHTVTSTKHAGTTSTASTTTSSPAGAAQIAIKPGDWLVYHLKAKGKGPKGSMSAEADIKVVVREVSQTRVRLDVKPLTTLSAEKRSLVLIGAMTGNKLILAVASGMPSTTSYSLPLGEPGKACPILAEARGKPYTAEHQGSSMGHKYTVKCTYTSKGILSKIVFKDTYSIQGQTLNTEITITLKDSSTDVGGKAQGEGGGGLPLTLIAAAGIVAVIIIAVALLKLRK